MHVPRCQRYHSVPCQILVWNEFSKDLLKVSSGDLLDVRLYRISVLTPEACELALRVQPFQDNLEPS